MNIDAMIHRFALPLSFTRSLSRSLAAGSLVLSKESWNLIMKNDFVFLFVSPIYTHHPITTVYKNWNFIHFIHVM